MVVAKLPPLQGGFFLLSGYLVPRVAAMFVDWRFFRRLLLVVAMPVVTAMISTLFR